MNAYELANYLDNNVEAMLMSEQSYIDDASVTLRYQADRIAELEKGCTTCYEAGKMVGKQQSENTLYTTPQTKPLSDEEIIKICAENGLKFCPNWGTTYTGNTEVLKVIRAIEERILGK